MAEPTALYKNERIKHLVPLNTLLYFQIEKII